MAASKVVGIRLSAEEQARIQRVHEQAPEVLKVRTLTQSALVKDMFLLGLEAWEARLKKREKK